MIDGVESVTATLAPGTQVALTPAEETAVQAKIINDATPYPGADIAAIKAKTDLLNLDTVIYPSGITVAASGNLTISSSVLVIGDIVVGAGASLTILGNLHVTGAFNAGADGVNILISGNLQVDQSAFTLGNGTSGTVLIGGNCLLSGNTAGAALIFRAGSSWTSGDINCPYNVDILFQGANVNFRAGAVKVGGYINGQQNGTVILIYGNCQTGLYFGIGGGTSGTANIYGTLKTGNGTIVNAGATLTYKHGVQPEAAINVNAIVASETVFFAPPGVSHSKITDLVLKCVDPGANTVNVRLYKFVNGVSTVVATFAITTSNFSTYYNIQSLFGRYVIAGDNTGTQITVQTSGGGPYAVTGSVTYEIY